ncbi:TolA protein [Minicystis rosea]|nr:TolA protein [Minicystis rosea]
MSTMIQRSSDTSVTFSLAELAKIEEERVREEDTKRARTREKEAQERREAEARRRAEEEARLAAENEARARARREEVERQARAEAREKAAFEVARIEAEAKARLDADNAARAHDLAVLRVQTESGRRRLQIMLGAVIGLAVCSGSAAAYGVTRRMTALEQSADQLREGQQALSRERDNAKATELTALDRRFAMLRARPAARDAEEARIAAEAARVRIDVKAPDHDRMRAFGDALDTMAARIDFVEKLELLDHRRDDLFAWAADRKRNEATTAARTAAARAKTGCDEASLQSYDRALAQLRDTLAQTPSAAGRAVAVRPQDHGGGRGCAEGDPGCGLDGKPLF